jgi:tetratricopeptide (TPR) repeat protein
VDRALALDSTLGGGHAILAQLLFLYDWDWRGAEQAFRRSLAINPNLPETHAWRARELMALGRTYDALDESRRALELSPLDPELRLQLVARYLDARQYDLAREMLRRALPADSSAPGPYYHAALLAAATGKYPDALAELRRPMTDAPDSVRLEAERARILALAGRRDEAIVVLRGLEQLARQRYVSPYALACIAAALGDDRQAFRWLDAAVRDRIGNLADARVDPRLDPLRSDRRFAALLGRLALSELSSPGP